MKAVLLAGGFGTRMRPLTFSRPKPLLPLVNKPILLHIIDHLRLHGVDEVFVTTNYLREQIISVVGHEYLGVKLHYPAEEQPLGTAGSVRNIKEGIDDTFIVMQGDTITDINLSALVKQHRFNSSLCTIAGYRVEDPWNYGIMELHDGGRVKHFHEKPMIEECSSNLANTGIYVLEPEALEFIPPNTFFDFAKDLFPRLLERGSIYGSEFSGFWVDVGQPGGYIKAKNWIMDRIEERVSTTAALAAKIQGKIVVGENSVLEPGVLLIGPVVIGNNVVVRKNSVLGPYTSIDSNVEVGESSVLDGSILFEQTRLGASGKINNSFIAEKCVIGNSSSIQSDVLIGSGCSLGGGISVTEGSRIWPNIQLLNNSMVSGTLRSFIPSSEIHYDARWSLRTVSADEAFYFNRSDGGYIQYTGLRARSLWEFNDILKHVDANSMKYHIRGGSNDFSSWLKTVISDMDLAKTFDSIKDDYVGRSMELKLIRKAMVEVTRNRINDLIESVRPSGYV